MRAMCVRAAVFHVCDVRLQFRTFFARFWVKKTHFCSFFAVKATFYAIPYLIVPEMEISV